MSESKDNVNHPDHYTDGGIETIDFIESHHLPYHLGNAIKYISRAGKKEGSDELEDLQKAEWYIRRFMEWKERPSSWRGADSPVIKPVHYGMAKKMKVKVRKNQK